MGTNTNTQASSAVATEVQELRDNQERLTDAMVALAAATTAVADSTVKRVPISKYKHTTPFNPDGLPVSHPSRKFTRRYYQSDCPIDSMKTSTEEIAELNKLKPGRYFDGFITVLEKVYGPDTQIHISYPSKTPDQRNVFKSMFRSFLDMLQQINAAHARGEVRPVSMS